MSTFFCSYILFVVIFLAPLTTINRKLRDAIDEDCVIHGSLNPNVVKSYGFLTITYEPKYYYWDFVILKRDFILNLIVTLYPVSTIEDFRVLLIGIVFFVYFYYH